MRAAILAALVFAVPAAAQQVAPTAPTYPQEMQIRKVGDRTVYVDRRGHTLYALDARVAYTRTAGESVICSGTCAQRWIPLAAPADAQPVGDWSVMVRGTAGPQWAWKSRPVFTRVADRGRGDLSGDGTDQLWSAIDYVPPAPMLAAPAIVKPLFADGAYHLADTDDHALFVTNGAIQPDWTPLLAGMAARSIGDWTVLQTGDRPQWAWRGKPVFVTSEDTPPAGTTLLRP